MKIANTAMNCLTGVCLGIWAFLPLFLGAIISYVDYFSKGGNPKAEGMLAYSFIICVVAFLCMVISGVSLGLNKKLKKTGYTIISIINTIILSAACVVCIVYREPLAAFGFDKVAGLNAMSAFCIAGLVFCAVSFVLIILNAAIKTPGIKKG